MFDTKNVKVGDEVLSHFTDYCPEEFIGVVVNKTPEGLVDVNTGNSRRAEIARYDKEGHEINTKNKKYFRMRRLEFLTEEKKREVRAIEKRHRDYCYIRMLNIRKLTDDELASVVKLLGEFTKRHLSEGKDLAELSQIMKKMTMPATGPENYDYTGYIRAFEYKGLTNEEMSEVAKLVSSYAKNHRDEGLFTEEELWSPKQAVQ